MTSPDQSTQFSARDFVPIFTGVLGAVITTLVTNAIASSPGLNLVGLAVGAAVGALVTANGPLVGLRAILGIFCTVIAIVVSYGGFAAYDVAKNQVGAIVPPLPAVNPSPSTQTTTTQSTLITQPTKPSPVTTGPTTCEGNLCIQIADSVHCEGIECPNPLTVWSTGSSTLEITRIEIEDDATDSFSQTSDCVGKSLEQGQSCNVTIMFSGAPVGVTAHAQLVVHQNLTGPASYVNLEGVGAAPPTSSSTPPVETNLDLIASSGIECSFTKAGMQDGSDAVQVFFPLTYEGDLGELKSLVQVYGVASNGQTTSYRSAVSPTDNPALSVAAFAAQSTDLSDSWIVEISVDPNDEVPEYNESNNGLQVRLTLPVADTQTVALNCSANPT